MTKLILQGGASSLRCEENLHYFREMLVGPSQDVRVLGVYFASEPAVWDEKFAQDCVQLEEAATFLGKAVSFVQASEDTDLFAASVAQADVILLRGGRHILHLQECLAHIEDLATLFSGKTIVGTSAGAYVLSQYYYSRRFGVRQGLGVYPFAVMAHYTDAFSADRNALVAIAGDLPLYALPECHFEVLYYDN